MPFYELLCIAKDSLTHVNMKDLLKTSAVKVLDKGGAVRGFSYFGNKTLPHRIKRHQEYHNQGRYWMMHFDCNPLVLHDLEKSLKLDPRVLRHNVVKVKDSLQTFNYVKKQPSKAY
ncbi:hypothetical protein H4R35_005342 [Dimargaris xerosporica]|nr:hypothetical protein H4R35_005342 [Dimargaris xerosporica]